jgi:hypothetical protein
MRGLLRDWPDVDDTDDESSACLAINNAMKDLLYGVGIDDQKAKELTGTDRSGMLLRSWHRADRQRHRSNSVRCCGSY